ncbi:MAG: DUF4412 domain-containing protein [Candidatus Omnitrophica bacterium]|nr:DUF4412 domain-containing protein [Candidatus Omnitrophota bacterium]
MTNIKKALFAAVAVVFFAASLCFAQKDFLKEANIDYSADEIITTEGMTMTSKVFYSPGKMRKDRNMEGMKQSVIIRHDKNIIWMLMTNERVYMEMPMDSTTAMGEDLSGDFAKNTVVHDILGEETLNGVKVTKAGITVKSPQSEEFEGLMWQAKNGIIVKMETDQMTMELTNIKQEKQDPRLFEIPDGYMKMNIPGMGGMGYN